MGPFIDLGIWNSSVLSWFVSRCSAKHQALCQGAALRLFTPTTSVRVCTSTACHAPRLVSQPRLPSLSTLAGYAHHALSSALVWHPVLPCPRYFTYFLLNFLWLVQLTTLKQMNRHMHRKDKLNFYSGHKISYNKAMPFYHRVAACSSVLHTDRKRRGKNGFSCFHHVTGWSVPGCK